AQKGPPVATATPVMVMTTVSEDGWATSVLPPPVWHKPRRCGVAWPRRFVRLMETAGDGVVAGATRIFSGLAAGTLVVTGCWATTCHVTSTTNRPAQTWRTIRIPPGARMSDLLLSSGYWVWLPPHDEVGGCGEHTVLALEGP